LGAALKTIGYCAAKDTIPFFSNDFYHRIALKIVMGANHVIDDIAREDPYWANRSLALRIAHEEYLDEAALEDLSIRDVLRLRSMTWGSQASARDHLMKSIATVSREVGSAADFEVKCKEKVRGYRAQAEKLERERSGLRLKIKCDVGTGLAGAATAVGAGAIAQLQTALGAATTLVAGCVFAFQKIKEYAPVAAQLRANEEEFRDSAGFGLHRFYSTATDAIRR
jgi:hypothetical protein